MASSLPVLRPAWIPAAALLLAGAAIGCSGGRGSSEDAGPGADGGDGGGSDEGGPDGGFDGGVLGRPCKPGDPCDDEVDCTIDACDEDRLRCRNQPDDHPCADEVFCNGDEVCDTRDGCVAGPPLACNDVDVCTIDSCDEETRTCIHAGRDFDADGHVDIHCESGDDCDDGNSRIFIGAREVCGDTLDNDCNGLTDDEETCFPAGYDTCDDPLDVSGGGVFVLEMGGTFSDEALHASCGFFTQHDAVLTFTLDEPKDVEVRADSDFGLTTVSLRTECDRADTELECNFGFPGRFRRRALPAGTYFVTVQTGSGDPVVARITFSDATEPPANDRCAGAIDVSAGGSWTGSFVDVVDDYAIDCGFSDGDLTYQFTLEETQDVVVRSSSDDGTNLSIAVQQTCGDQRSETRCTYAAPADFRLYSQPRGTYYLIVESGSENEFELDVSFEPPSSPPRGDTCAAPIDVSAGGIFENDLADMQDDHETGCGFFYRETVYELDLDETKDVFLEASDDFTYISVRDTCDTRATERRCVWGDPAHATLRSLGAGRHYVMVESFRPVSYSLAVTLADPAPIVDVVGNDLCGDEAYVIAAPAGGVFRGDTTGMAHDFTAGCGFDATSPDVAFKFVLGAAARMTASLEGSLYNAVLHLHRGNCNLIAEVECSDSFAGGEGRIQRNLAPDTYFLIVDGFGGGSDGPYLLDVTFD